MWPNPLETPDLVTFTEEILNGKLHFLCSEDLVVYKPVAYKKAVHIPDTKYSSVHCRSLLFNKVVEHFGLLLLRIILTNLSLVDTVWLPLSLNIKSLAKIFVDSFLLTQIILSSNYSKCFNFFSISNSCIYSGKYEQCS